MKYIHKDIGIYEVAETLSDNYAIGTTAEDLSNGKFILLNEQQEAFALSHPSTSVYEIFNKEITPLQVVPISILRNIKTRAIEAHDSSEAVNGFYINGVAMWLDRSTRSSLISTIAAYKAYSLAEITLWTEGSNPIPITLAIEALESLLIALEMYAKACYDTTAAHKANVQQLTTNQEIEDYDFLEGYPEKLNININ